MSSSQQKANTMRIKHTIFFLLVCFSSLTIHAQNTDLADTFQLEEIVVAGTRMPVTGEGMGKFLFFVQVFVFKTQKKALYEPQIKL